MARGPGLGGVESTVPAEEGLRRPSLEYRGPNTGAALAGVANDAVALNAEIQKRDASSYAALQVPQAHVAAEKAMLDAQSQPKDVIDKAGGLTPYVMTQFKQFADSATQGAPNPLGQRMMKEHMASIGASVQMRAMEADAEAQQTRRLAQAQDGMTAAATAAQLNPDAWKDIGAQQISAYDGMGISDTLRSKLGTQMDGQVRAAAGRGYADKDPASVLNRLNDANDDLFQHFDLKEREAIQGYAKDKLAGKEADGIVDFTRSSGPDAGARAMRDLNANPNLPDDIKDSIRQRVQTGLGEWRSEMREQYGQQLMDLHERVGSGQADLTDIGKVNSLYSKGVLGGAEAGTIKGEIERQHMKKADDQLDLFNAQNAFKNGTAMDPKDEHAKAGVNQLFNAMTANMQTGSQEWTNTGAQVAKVTGVVPQYMMDWGRTQLNAGPPEQRAAAADMISRMEDASPRGIGFAIDDKTKAMAANINQFVRGGASPQDAVTRAQALDTLKPEEKQRLEEAFKANGKNSIQARSLPDLQKMISADDKYKGTGIMGTDFFREKAPEIPLPMQAEFETSRQKYYLMTGGDKDVSAQMAYNDVKNQWGITQVNGPREFMRGAPEALNPGLASAPLRDDIQQAAKAFMEDNSPNADYIKNFAPELRGKDFVPEGQDREPWMKARLVPHPEATFHSDYQLWSIAVPTANGLYATLTTKKGEPAIYALPSASEARAAEYKKQADAGMAQARAQVTQSKENDKAFLEAQQQSAELGGGY